MRFDVLTLFPQMVEDALQHSIPARAIAAGELELGLHDIRDFSVNKHKNVDDNPYGGGPGMVLAAEPVVRAIEAVKEAGHGAHVIAFAPSGTPFTQARARELAAANTSVALLCGRYEGFDERITAWCDETLSVGDYVLSGGELAALVVIDAVTRLRPGVLGNEASAEDESLEMGTLEYPHYTRPRTFRGMEVPEVLLSGDHARIHRWRRREALRRTRDRRPDLFGELSLSETDKKLLES
ncbi:MAG: tRNA (guanine37-N1)-methyltransferase [Myxococcota bacterium]